MAAQSSREIPNTYTRTSIIPSISESPFSPSLAEMRSSEASSSLPFRSKKTLNPIPKAKPQAQALDLNPLSTKTPTKQPQLPRRTRKHNVALSLKEVRKAAQSSLSGSNQKSPSDRTDQISSARRKIVDFPEENAAGKSKTESGASPKLPEK